MATPAVGMWAAQVLASRATGAAAAHTAAHATATANRRCVGPAGDEAGRTPPPPPTKRPHQGGR